MFYVDACGIFSAPVVPQLTELAGEHKLGDSVTKAVGEILKGTEGNVTFKLSGTEYTAGYKQITAGVEQISQVIQTNAATAEETSALCASLNGQSKQLQGQVAHFKTN